MHFWQSHTLKELTTDQWESLCDGCGKCCVHKLEDEDTGTIHYTDVACDLLDIETARCSDYANRLSKVPNCLNLSPDNIDELAFMLPDTCAYQRMAKGLPLASWHPLLTGTTLAAKWSVRRRVVAEKDVAEHEIEERVVVWC